jgi:hypothetical protein
MMGLAPFLHIQAREMKSQTVTCAGMQSLACCVSALRRSTFVVTCQLLQDWWCLCRVRMHTQWDSCATSVL